MNMSMINMKMNMINMQAMPKVQWYAMSWMIAYNSLGNSILKVLCFCVIVLRWKVNIYQNLILIFCISFLKKRVSYVSIFLQWKIKPKYGKEITTFFRRTCAYQGVRNVYFSEILACFAFLKQPFWDLPFCHITDAL